jgi:hypothetical protein
MKKREESESEDEDKGLVIDISNKKRKMMATRLGRTKDDEDIDEVDTDKTSPELAITKVQKRIFDNEVNDNDEEKDNNEDSDCGGSWLIEKRKKDNEIAMLKWKIKTLETTLKDMQSTSRVTG